MAPKRKNDGETPPSKKPSQKASPKSPAPCAALPLPALSDGHALHHPTDLQNTQTVETDDGRAGQYYFAGPLPSTDPLTARWLNKLGTLLAKEAGKNPALKKALGDSKNHQNPRLERLPPGYEMFEHRFSLRAGIRAAEVTLESPSKKGKDKALTSSIGKSRGPKDTIRTDPYVYGHPGNARFRSCEEMLPHLVWLYTDPTLDHRNCACKYCKDYLKKLARVLAGSEQVIVLEQQVNPDSNEERKHVLYDTADPPEGTLVRSLVPQFRIGELVWVKMKVTESEDEPEEGVEVSVKGADWRISLDDGTIGVANASSSSASAANADLNLSNPEWPCRIVSRFVRIRAEGGYAYSYSVYPLQTNGDLLGVAEDKIIPYLARTAPKLAASDAEPGSLASALSLALAQASRIASRIRPTECYAWHHIGSRDRLTAKDEAWIDKMESLNHYKGLHFGPDFVRRGDLIRVIPDKGMPKRSYLKVTSIYQDLVLVHMPTGKEVSSEKAVKYPLAEVKEVRTLRITGDEMYTVLVPLSNGAEREVWHLAARSESTTEITHGDVAHRWRPQFAFLEAVKEAEVKHEGDEEEGWGADGDARKRASDAGWNDADVAESFGVGVPRPGKRAEGSSARGEMESEATLPAGPSGAGVEEEEADFDEFEVSWD